MLEKMVYWPSFPLSYGSPALVLPSSPEMGSWPVVAVVVVVLASSFLVGSPQIARDAAAVMLLTVSMLLVGGMKVWRIDLFGLYESWKLFVRSLRDVWELQVGGRKFCIWSWNEMLGKTRLSLSLLSLTSLCQCWLVEKERAMVAHELSNIKGEVNKLLSNLLPNTDWSPRHLCHGICLFQVLFDTFVLARSLGRFQQLDISPRPRYLEIWPGDHPNLSIWLQAILLGWYINSSEILQLIRLSLYTYICS